MCFRCFSQALGQLGNYCRRGDQDSGGDISSFLNPSLVQSTTHYILQARILPTSLLSVRFWLQRYVFYRPPLTVPAPDPLSTFHQSCPVLDWVNPLFAQCSEALPWPSKSWSWPMQPFKQDGLLDDDSHRAAQDPHTTLAPGHGVVEALVCAM